MWQRVGVTEFILYGDEVLPFQPEMMEGMTNRRPTVVVVQAVHIDAHLAALATRTVEPD